MNFFRGVSPPQLMAVLAMLVGGAMFGKWFDAPGWRIGLPGFLLFFAGAVIQLRTISRLASIRTGPKKRDAEPREILVQFLSPGDPATCPVPLTDDLEADLKALAAKKRESHVAGARPQNWPWEQTLRGIYHNVPKLQRVILIGSPATVVQVKTFYDEVICRYFVLKNLSFQVFLKNGMVLKSLTPGDVASSSENGFDFENFDEVADALEAIVEQLKAEEQSPQGVERRLQIDITGGQKPNSVVAAVVTVLSKITNQYVATNPNDSTAAVWEYPVWGYDAFYRDG